MPDTSPALGRRALLAAGAAALPATVRAQGGPQGRHPPITIIINQSPWLDSFQRLVAQYERESGNKVEPAAVENTTRPKPDDASSEPTAPAAETPPAAVAPGHDTACVRAAEAPALRARAREPAVWAA